MPPIALLAFMELPSYSVDEENEIVGVCVVLEGAMETNLSLRLITVDMTATGITIIIIQLV